MAKRAAYACALSLLFAACLLLTAQAGRVDDEQEPMQPASGSLTWDPPEWCRDKQCPEFGVVQTTGNVQLRRYKAARWIMVNESQPNWSQAYKSGYKKLQDYVNGNNQQHTKLDQTNPSLTIFYPAGEGRAFQPIYTIEYFVPFALQGSPPQPASDELQILSVPEQDIWVLTFDGFPDENEVIKRSFDLIEQLESQGQTIDRAWVGFASYELPVRVLDRHNEVWVWPKQQPSAKAGAAAASNAPKSVEGAIRAAFTRLFGANKK